MNNKTRLYPIFFAAAALIVVALACGSTSNDPAPVKQQPTQEEQAKPSATPEDKPASPAASDIKIESYKLSQDNGSGKAGDEVKSFKPSDHVQYFDVQLTDFLKAGSVVKWVFTAVDTSAGKNLKITEVETKVVVANHLNSQLSLDKDFPTGSFKADISVDGTPIGTIDYTVSE
jgi:hypothetical protein